MLALGLVSSRSLSGCGAPQFGRERAQRASCAVPNEAKQTKAHRRREMALRAAACRRVAIRRGRRNVCALIDVLADYGAISASLPFPTQVQLGEDLGVDERTIRRWAEELVAMGVLIVFVSLPVRDRATGRWGRRQSNRYLLADLRARAHGPCCPLRRRRVKSLGSPTGQSCPVTGPTEVQLGGGGRFKPADPPTTGVVEGGCNDELVAVDLDKRAERARVAELLAGMRATIGPRRR
jgi:hypothetical protein